MTNQPNPTSVVLIGRTNVGKSTLFNRLIGLNRAIVSSEAGTTRDRNSTTLVWRGQTLWLTDTGGLDPVPQDPAAAATTRQVEQALKGARVILFVVDGRTGLTPAERGFARHLRRLKAHVILVINKIDNPRLRQLSAVSSLGFKDTIMVSALSGSGLGDLLDLVTSEIRVTISPPTPQLRLALVGKTNVGKSSLFNRLLQEDRSIVLSTPHTTRDAIREYLQTTGVTVELIDTAGLRRQLMKAPQLEQQSVKQTMQALTEVEVAVLVLDGAGETTWQDQRLGDLVVQAGVAAVVVINKADLVLMEERPNVIARLKRWLPMLNWTEVLWVSALTGRGSARLIPAARAALAAWHRELSPQELTSFTSFLKKSRATRDLPLGTFTQTSTRPPSFNLQLKTKENIPAAISGWIERELRQHYGLLGTPLRVRLQGLRKR